MTRKHLVSCLCISSGRPGHLKKAIAYFQAQTYTEKELLIISAKNDAEYVSVIASFGDNRIRYCCPEDPGAWTLGELRNYAIEKATGEYFCVWDDDDWYPNKRIEIQLNEAIRNKKKGTVLPYYILYNAVSKEAWMSVPIPLPASVLCRKDAITENLQYRERDRSEDAVFVGQLNKENILFPVIDPLLYIYIFHGGNTWNSSHFTQFCGRKFSDEAARLISDVAEGKYTCEEGAILLHTKGVREEFDYFDSFINAAGEVKAITTETILSPG